MEKRSIVNNDEPIILHKSLYGIMDSFRNIIASVTGLKVSVDEAEKYFNDLKYILELTCSVTDKMVKIDKSILSLIKKENFSGKSPLYSNTLIDFFRIFTIAAKDIIGEEQDFKDLLYTPELQFLKHLRNASAHSNSFYGGVGKNRQIPTSIIGRSKVIEKSLEGSSLYMNFMKPGDLSSAPWGRSILLKTQCLQYCF